jgi:dihydroorotase
LIGVSGGTLQAKTPADLVVVDAERRWKVDATSLQSKSYNTPLDGTELYGVVLATFVEGRRKFVSPSVSKPLFQSSLENVQ